MALTTPGPHVRKTPSARDPMPLGVSRWNFSILCLVLCCAQTDDKVEVGKRNGLFHYMMQGVVKRLNLCGWEPIYSTPMRPKAVTIAISEYNSSEGD